MLSKRRGCAGPTRADRFDARLPPKIATRARVSKRELYSLFGNKEAMLVACIVERAQRLKAPLDLPELRDREILSRC